MTRVRSRIRAILALTVCGVAAMPLHAQRFAAVDAAVNNGIRTGVFPGAVVVIGRRDSVLYTRGYGHYTWGAKSARPDPATTLWDIASLTKVVGTASAAAVLVDEGKLDLDAPVSRYLPEFSGESKDHVTVRMLLDHTSGLPAYLPFYRTAKTADAALQQLLSTPLTRDPGRDPVYSDLNAMIAGVVVARAAGSPLDTFVSQSVFAPLGMKTSTWRIAASDRTRVAPTGRFRGHPVAGVVNDENARILGGVAGHAGVFSTGLDLARFAQSWLRDSSRTTANWLHPSTLDTFLHRSSAMSGTRALGWDTPHEPDDGGPSLYGRCFTSTTVGHTGWTGTTLWLDRGSDLFLVLLTNRSYQPRAPRKSLDQMRLVRAAVSDAARRGIGECGGGRVR